ncbi:arsenate reductase family protein [Metabacillus malikii]|uniref:Arsenate reductase n=1 Tax=Metabacillus malikii TaxID=1504265 RepID=A0ABT9ZBN9_9BACI|nr:arsenate reductase family protein [Metabacillus malikii]MDQ0229678.1 arsenate reductase [Metabacillus malikii]
MSINFYWYPKCGTCRKAKKWLEEHNVQFNEIHIVENPPSKDEIATFIEKSGIEMKKFFNTSGQVYRELGLKDKLATMSDEEKLELLASNGMLLKRPIAAGDNDVTVGFKEEEYERTWGGK